MEELIKTSINAYVKNYIKLLIQNKPQTEEEYFKLWNTTIDVSKKCTYVKRRGKTKGIVCGAVVFGDEDVCISHRKPDKYQYENISLQSNIINHDEYDENVMNTKSPSIRIPPAGLNLEWTRVDFENYDIFDTLNEIISK